MSTRTDRVEAVLLTILLAFGASVSWGIAVGWTLDTIDRSRAPQASKVIGVQQDGTLLLATTIGDVSTYCQLDGEPVDADGLVVAWGTNLYRPAPSRVPSGGLPWRDRVVQIHRNYKESRPGIWYVVHDGNLPGHAYLVGYNEETKLRMGYVGRTGFQKDEPPLESQFPVSTGLSLGSRYIALPGDSYSFDYFLTDEGLMRIDWTRREVELAWADRGSASIAWSWVPNADRNLPGAPQILIRTPTCVHLQDVYGKTQETYTLPPELRETNPLRWVSLPDGRVVAWVDENDPELFWLDPRGVARREKVTLRMRPEERAVTKSVFFSLVVPAPALFAASTAAMLFDPPKPYRAASLGARWASVLSDSWLGLLIVGTFAIVPAALCQRRQRKFGLARTPMWMTLILLFGLPAYFGYLLHRRWPASLPCPHCGRHVPRDRSECLACHQDFPAPALSGTEIFA